MSRITTLDIVKMKLAGKRISMLTCYDATFASLLDHAGIHMLLVGDSLGMVIKGEENTLNVTMEQIVYHTTAVANGAKKAHIVADMPFMSYQAGDDIAVANAGRLLQAGAQSVKLEGGQAVAPLVKRIVSAGIPVMGHVGLLPQSFNQLGGYTVQGKSQAAFGQIVEDAMALQEAGAYAIVIEGVVDGLAQAITNALKIPTIGIGAGNACDGQVLVLYDCLRLQGTFRPKFVKQFALLDELVISACKQYISEVQAGTFPADEHTYRVHGKVKYGQRQGE